MKKKGLIISTVVMVVVLIASLTTATYAWFTTSASARLENLQVKTASSQGLQIGSYTIGGEAPTITNWGLSYAFEDLEPDATGFMAVSGDGITMFKLADKEPTDHATGKPADTAKINDAVAGTDYFVGYIALKDTRTGESGAADAKDILLNTIDIQTIANANNPQADGMLAAMRIAVFAREAGPTTGDNFDKDDLVMVYEPYAYYKYAIGANWSKYTAPQTTQYLTSEGVTEGEADGGAGAYTSGTTQYNKMKKGSFDAAKIVTPNQPDVVNAAPTSFTAPYQVKLTSGNVVLKTGSTGQDGMVYLMIVVWFEGEDNECISAFAGGGATISMEFTIEE